MESSDCGRGIVARHSQYLVPDTCINTFFDVVGLCAMQPRGLTHQIRCNGRLRLQHIYLPRRCGSLVRVSKQANDYLTSHASVSNYIFYSFEKVKKVCTWFCPCPVRQEAAWPHGGPILASVRSSRWERGEWMEKQLCTVHCTGLDGSLWARKDSLGKILWVARIRYPMMDTICYTTTPPFSLWSTQTYLHARSTLETVCCIFKRIVDRPLHMPTVSAHHEA